MWIFALVGAAMLVVTLVTTVRAILLEANGVTGRAEVLAVQESKSSYVRVRLESGQERYLWAWSGSPKVGSTITVVYLEDLSRVKQSGTFLPESFWMSVGAVVFCGAVAAAMLWKARSEAGPRRHLVKLPRERSGS